MGTLKRIIAGLTLPLIVGLASCADGPDVAQTRVVGIDPAMLEDEVISPVVRGGSNGLEMRWWVVDDRPGAVESALEPYASMVPTTVCDTRAWRDNGLRLMRASLSDLPAMKEALPILGRVDRRWLGQVPRWTEALLGDESAGTTLCAVDGRLVELPAGRLRLLARAWTSPSMDGPVIRADLALQHMPRREALVASIDPTEDAVRFAPEKQGVLFGECAASLTLEPGYVYFLVPEAPERDWVEPEVDPVRALYDLGRRIAGETVGPPGRLIPTIGQALLQRDAPERGKRRHGVRAIVMMIPRVPERFALLP